MFDERRFLLFLNRYKNVFFAKLHIYHTYTYKILRVSSLIMTIDYTSFFSSYGWHEMQKLSFSVKPHIQQSNFICEWIIDDKTVFYSKFFKSYINKNRSRFKNDSFLTLFEILCLTNRYLSNFTCKFITDDVTIFKHFQSFILIGTGIWFKNVLIMFLN